MKKVLMALDYSPAATSVAKKGFELASSIGAKVTLVHVLSDITYYSSLNYSPITGFDNFSTMDIVQSSTREELTEAAAGFLERFKEKYAEGTVKTVIKEGDFAEEILKLAAEEKSDTIIMGTHSRRGIDKILMGSVAEKVLHKTEVPVYIIPIRKS